ncbi:FRG domain-containing protein [Flavobacterium terrae]|uniref:FRG domain-containing protein n=1 Tax=Flavobacterium terrae TaxID=415425 RepID=A0A1M6HCV6_9FLAO|nr:FRG domain-containing protein [Flavobacterium terrae]SHJ20022.1 FRG domain-containing protein [Flavobacterium terrae]
MNLFKHLPIELRIQQEAEINPNGKIIRGIKPIDMTTYWQYDFEENCDAFFECFNDPFSELYGPNQSSDAKYIFRGHRDATWKLIPSVFRNYNDETNINSLNILNSGNGHFLPELTDFINFIKGLNSLGYKIEDDTFKLINSVLTDDTYKASDLIKNFPKKEQLKELALAQHYGVQTRLLDFTFNPNKAIFFASEKIKHPRKEDNFKMGIWAIPERLIEICQEDFYLEKIFIEGFQNNNMIAQQGLFINYFKDRSVDENLYNSEGKIKSLDEYLYEYKKIPENERLINEKIGKPSLFTLSHSVAWQVSKRLDILNVNWFTIQPDLDGVKKEVERKRNHHQ